MAVNMSCSIPHEKIYLVHHKSLVTQSVASYLIVQHNLNIRALTKLDSGVTKNHGTLAVSPVDMVWMCSVDLSVVSRVASSMR